MRECKYFVWVLALVAVMAVMGASSCRRVNLETYFTIEGDVASSTDPSQRVSQSAILCAVLYTRSKPLKFCQSVQPDQSGHFKKEFHTEAVATAFALFGATDADLDNHYDVYLDYGMELVVSPNQKVTEPAIETLKKAENGALLVYKFAVSPKSLEVNRILKLAQSAGSAYACDEILLNYLSSHLSTTSSADAVRLAKSAKAKRAKDKLLVMAASLLN